MYIERLYEIINSDFYTGVPDSQLKPLCNFLMDKYGIDPKHHVIAANEGNCVSLAAGYHLATGKIPVVYMQNSGEGNIINPVVSLLNQKVYSIPMIFIIGWRGEPGVHDEPQHSFQGEITTKLLEDMEIEYYIIDAETLEKDITVTMIKFNDLLEQGRNVAFIVKKGALIYQKNMIYSNEAEMKREDIIRKIVSYAQEDPIICTTGKASRELFEIRDEKEQSHKYDFLTVGSMGHCSSVALGVAINKPKTKIWCIDGDGAMLMHMGAIAVIGSISPGNLIHIVINNGSHETVGGMPTVASKINLSDIAKACGYSYAIKVSTIAELNAQMDFVKNYNKLCFIEALSSIGSRKELKRPNTSTFKNKSDFVEYLKNCE